MVIIDRRYKIVEQIGEGGMGVVHRGLDKKTDRTIAIKQLKREAIQAEPNLIKRFEWESRILQKLAHPNVVKRYAGPLKHKNEYYIIMEYVEGGTLHDLIRRYGRLNARKALSIALELSDALIRAHHLNIIHRDLKPANVLLTHNEKPRLTDFGIAHVEDRTRLTQSNEIMGTWAYLSPEAVSGSLLTESADIWAFGILLFEMLEGTIPYEDTNPANIVRAITNGNIREGRHIPERIQVLISKMLQKDPDNRLPSMRAASAEIHAILHGSNPIELRSQIDLMSELGQLIDNWQTLHDSSDHLLKKPLDQEAFHYHSGVRDTLRVLLEELENTFSAHKISLPPVNQDNYYAPMTIIAVKDLLKRTRLEVKNITAYDDFTFTATFPINLQITNRHRQILLEQFMPNIIILTEGYTEGNLPFMHFGFKRNIY